MGPAMDLYISHIEKEGTFLKLWGQRDKEAVANVERMLLNLTEDFDNGKYMADPQDLHPDLLCCSRYDDGRYYRAKILEYNPHTGMANCHYLDYGNRHCVKFHNLRVPKNLLQTLFRSPAQATSYILSGVVGSWSLESLTKISEEILYEEARGIVVKSIGQHQEIHLLKLLLENEDYAERLCKQGIACPIKDHEFEVMIWTQLAFPNPQTIPITAYQYPQGVLAMNQPWPPMCFAQPSMVPPVATFTMANGPRLSVSSVPAPVVSRGEVIRSIPTKPLPTKSNTQQVEISRAVPTQPLPPKSKPAHVTAASFASIQLQNNSEHTVFVSHVDKGTFCFYAQLDATSDELNDLAAKLNDPAQSYSNLKHPIIPGTSCLAKFSEDDAIYRSTITSIGEDKCQVYFVDYGNCDSVKYMDLFEIPPEFIHPKVMAVPFVLSGVNKVNATDEMLAAFYELVLEKNCVLKVVPPKSDQLTPKQHAELFIDETNVRELITVEILRKKPKLKNAPFPNIGSKVKVKGAYVNSVHRFFVQPLANSADLTAVMDLVAEHCKGAGKPLRECDIQPGAVCCALFADEWYRAMILDTEPQLKIIFVDYGNEEVTQADQLRSTTDEIMNKLVAQAIPCRLFGVEMDEALTPKLDDLVVEETFTMHVVDVDMSAKDPCVVVELFNDQGENISGLLKPKEVATVVSAPDLSRQSQNFKTDPKVWGIESNSNRKGGNIGHCDRMDNSYREESRSSSRNSNNHAGSCNGTQLEQVPGNKVSDTWEDVPALTIPKWSVEIGSKRQVSVVFTTNPCDFYIHESGADSDNLQDSIEQHYEKGGKPLTPSLRTQGSVCIAKFSEDGCLYRAEIIKTSNQQTQVQFLDYGNVDMVDNNDLFQIDSRFVSQKAKAVHCRLIGVSQMVKWSDEDIKKFESLTESDELEAEFLEVDNGLYSVILRGNTFSETVNESFGATTDTMLTKSTIVNSVKGQTPLAVGSDHSVEITWYETPARFFIQKQSSEFLELMKSIQKVYKNKQPLQKPAIGQAVVALFSSDGAFYRGEIKIERGGKFGVHYIDYGNKSLVDPSHIYGLEHQFSILPAQAMLCELGDVQPLDGQWVKNPQLAKYFQGQFTCSILKTGECSTVRLSCKGQDVASQLVSKGLAMEPYVPSLPVKQPEPYVALVPVKLPEPYVPPVTSKQPAVVSTEVTPTVQPLCETSEPLEQTEKPGINSELLISQFVQATILSIDHQSLFVTFESTSVCNIKNDVASCVAQGLCKLPPHLVSVGSWCLVMDKHSDYKRAVIVDNKSTSGVAVKFLDCGGFDEISSHNMFLLPEKLANISALAHECLISNTNVKNLQPFTNKKVTLFVESYENERFNAQVLDECGQPFSFAPLQTVCAPQILPMAILKQGTVVDVIHAADNSVWLQQAKDSAIVNQLLDGLFETFEEGGDSLIDCNAGDLCAAKSEDGNWYRAKVTRCVPDHVEVQYLDYGNSEEVPRDNLKVLNKFFNIPALAIKAELPIVPKDGENIGETILEMVNEKSFVAYFSRNGNEWLVELLDGKEVFSMKLIRTGKALSMGNNPFPALMRKPLVSLKLNQTVTADLSFAESISEFYVHLSSRSEELQKMESDLKSTSFCMTTLKAFPPVGTRVMALYEDGVWYRGEVLPDQRIYFIDYGNVDKVNLDCLKVLPPALGEVENLAVRCSLHSPNNKIWAENAFDQFLPYVEAGAFSITVKAVSGNIYSVDVRDSSGASIVDKLVDAGLLEDPPSGGGCTAERTSLSSCELDASSNEESMPVKHKAEIVWSNSPSDFYVQLDVTSQSADKIAAELEEAAKFPNCENLSKGKICAALFPDDNLWYRAKVLDQSSDIQVSFIDFGNTSVTTETKELPQYLKDMPPLALHCSLPEPSGVSWSDSSYSLFTKLVDECEVEVELLTKDEPHSVNLYVAGENIITKLVPSSGLDDFVKDLRATSPLTSLSSTVAEERHVDSNLEPNHIEATSGHNVQESAHQISPHGQTAPEQDIDPLIHGTLGTTEDRHSDGILEATTERDIQEGAHISPLTQTPSELCIEPLNCGTQGTSEVRHLDIILEPQEVDATSPCDAEESTSSILESPLEATSGHCAHKSICHQTSLEPSIDTLKGETKGASVDIILEPDQTEATSVHGVKDSTSQISFSLQKTSSEPCSSSLIVVALDTSDLGETENNLVNPVDVSLDVIPVDMANESVIVITPHEKSIPVITLNESDDENILDITLDSNITESQNDSVVEITQSEDIVIIPSDLSDSISLANDSIVIDPLETIEEEHELATSEECYLTSPENVENCNSNTDGAVQVGESCRLALEVPGISIPDSSTVDSEYSQLMVTCENIESHKSKEIVFSETLVTSSFKTNSQKTIEIQENRVSSNDKMGEVFLPVSSSTEQCEYEVHRRCTATNEVNIGVDVEVDAPVLEWDIDCCQPEKPKPISESNCEESLQVSTESCIIDTEGRKIVTTEPVSEGKGSMTSDLDNSYDLTGEPNVETEAEKQSQSQLSVITIGNCITEDIDCCKPEKPKPVSESNCEESLQVSAESCIIDTEGRKIVTIEPVSERKGSMTSDLDNSYNLTGGPNVETEAEKQSQSQLSVTTIGNCITEDKKHSTEHKAKCAQEMPLKNYLNDKTISVLEKNNCVQEYTVCSQLASTTDNLESTEKNVIVATGDKKTLTPISDGIYQLTEEGITCQSEALVCPDQKCEESPSVEENLEEEHVVDGLCLTNTESNQLETACCLSGQRNSFSLGETHVNNQDKESDVVVSLRIYPDERSSELDINGISHGHCLARATDFMSDFAQGMAGRKTYSFEDCEHHQATVEIRTTVNKTCQ